MKPVEVADEGSETIVRGGRKELAMGLSGCAIGDEVDAAAILLANNDPCSE